MYVGGGVEVWHHERLLIPTFPIVPTQAAQPSTADSLCFHRKPLVLFIANLSLQQRRTRRGRWSLPWFSMFLHWCFFSFPHKKTLWCVDWSITTNPEPLAFRWNVTAAQILIDEVMLYFTTSHSVAFGNFCHFCDSLAEMLCCDRSHTRSTDNQNISDRHSDASRNVCLFVSLRAELQFVCSGVSPPRCLRTSWVKPRSGGAARGWTGAGQWVERSSADPTPTFKSQQENLQVTGPK